jgi:hypothetical protein
MYHVYELRDPVTGRPRWVGHTGDTTNRLKQHLGGQNKSTTNWIADLKRRHLAPTLVLVSKTSSKKKSLSTESKHIRKLREAGEDLLNVSMGITNHGLSMFDIRANAKQMSAMPHNKADIMIGARINSKTYAMIVVEQQHVKKWTQN